MGAKSTTDEFRATVQKLCGDLRTYDPSTHVCVSRECAKAALFNMPDSAEGGVSPREYAARAELRAALEVT